MCLAVKQTAKEIAKEGRKESSNSIVSARVWPQSAYLTFPFAIADTDRDFLRGSILGNLQACQIKTCQIMHRSLGASIAISSK